MQKSFQEIANVPIYGSTLVLDVSDNIQAAIKKSAFYRQHDPKDDNNSAMCVQDENNFGLFFPFNRLSPGVIAHEVFHTTHHLLQYVGQKFDPENHECFAYLNDWMTEWVHNALNKHKARIIKNPSFLFEPPKRKLKKKN